MNKKKISYLTVAVIAVLAIVGIAVGVNRSGTTSTHNATDVAFAQDMIPHHEQAVEMAKYVSSRSTNPQVLALATKIEAAQSPEIKEMTGWLQSWHATVPSNSADMGGMNMGGNSSMQGMMSDSDMTMLQTLNGTAFDKMWLTMMTTHHTGAIDMAKTELTSGKYAASKTLAQNITSSQSVQIAEMQQMLKQL